ncbi:MAG TPA: glycosyltransferase family 87 protein [Gemmatimonadales bacterium]
MVTAAVGWLVHRHRPLLTAGDAAIYAAYARRTLAGQLPYSDFQIEYPPLSLLPFLMPHLLTGTRELTGRQYGILFGLSMLVLATLVAVVAGRTRRHLPDAVDPWPVIAFAAAVVLLAPVMLWRYDLVPALCTALALLAILRGRPGWSGFALGLGVAAKLYPVVLGAVVFAERLARRDAHGLRALVLGGLAALTLTVLPAVVTAPAGLARVWRYHAERGIQVESVAGGLILLAARQGWTDAAVVESHGADHIVSPWADAVRPVLPLATVAGILLVAALAYRRFRQEEAAGDDTSQTLVAYSTLALLVFMLTSKVLSPQYCVWLLPLIPLLPTRHSTVVLGASALTAALYPWHYWELLRVELPAVLLLNARNAALLLAALALLREYAASPVGAAPARESEGHPGTPPGYR